MKLALALSSAALIAVVLVAAVALWRSGEGDASGPSGPRAQTDPAELQAARRQALALVSYPWRRLGYRIRFAPGRPGLRGETDRDTRMITIFVFEGDVPHRIAHDVAHEIGHAVDDRLLTSALRRAYLARRGAPGAPWFPGEAVSDYRTGAGDFAEVFALCYAPSPEFRSRLAPPLAEPCAALPLSARRAILGQG